MYFRFSVANAFTAIFKKAFHALRSLRYSIALSPDSLTVLSFTLQPLSHLREISFLKFIYLAMPGLGCST